MSKQLSPNHIVPSFLTGYEKQYQVSRKQATLQWFKDAKFGLFMHYGLYSVLGKGEWAMIHDKISYEEYNKLKNQFTAENFNADAITDMAIAAGMKYVNITTRHHEGFCLFRTQQTDYNSLNAPCGRDLVAELAKACQKKKLGLFLYYSYAADWQHPYYFSRDAGWQWAQPEYDHPNTKILWRKDEDFQHYINFVHEQLRELLTQYGTIAGLWFDPMMAYYMRPDLFPIKQTYELIRSIQPECLIAFKQGANGDEDFSAPERSSRSLGKNLQGDASRLADQVWKKNKDKPKEICDTLQPRVWGYNKHNNGQHRNVDDVLRMLAYAKKTDANILLNTGPLPDGSIDPVDEKTLREVGRRLRAGVEWDLISAESMPLEPHNPVKEKVALAQ